MDVVVRVSGLGVGWWLLRAGYSGVKDGWSNVLHVRVRGMIEEYKLQVPIVLSENEGGAPAQTNNKTKKKMKGDRTCFSKGKKESWKRRERERRRRSRQRKREGSVSTKCE